MSRRAAFGLALLPSLLLVQSPALALIPDEEDEELVEKAKANRRSRLAQQKATTREFIQAEGLKNSQLDSQLIPVQKAVSSLAKSGSQIESGDLRGASATLSDAWAGEFEVAARSLSTSDAAKASVDAVFTGLSDTKSAAGAGDANATKKSFVTLVAALESWAADVGVAESLKGL